MDLIFQAETSQLHAHQIGYGRQKKAFFGDGGLGEVWEWLQVLGPHLFSHEDEMNCAVGLGLSGIDQEVHSGGVAIAKSEILDGGRDSLQVLPLDRDVNVLRQSR